MSDDWRAILYAAAQGLPPLFPYGPAPIRHRLYPGLVMLASGLDEGSGGVGEHAALLFEPVTPEHFFLWTTEFFGAGHPFSVTVEAGTAAATAPGAHRGGGRKKVKYRIARTDGELFAFAGLYQVLPLPAGEGQLHTCAIITTVPNAVVAPSTTACPSSACCPTTRTTGSIPTAPSHRSPLAATSLSC